MIGHKFDPASSKWRMHIADAYEAAFKKIHPELHLVLECNRNVYKNQTGDMPRAWQNFFRHLFTTFDLFTHSTPRTYGRQPSPRKC